MIDPRLGWFAMGATFGLVLSGWPWHPRFSRYSRMQDPDWRRSFNHENTNAPQKPPPFKFRRSEPDPPEQFIRMDEGRIQRGNGSGETTTPKPNIVPKPQPPGGRVTDVYGRTIGYQPRPQGSTPNPPPTDP